MLPKAKPKQVSSITDRVWSPTGINVYKKVFGMNDQNMKAHIGNLALKKYGQPAKPLQIDAVANLVSGRNTFVLAGTGFGKSRIAEIYFGMIPLKKKSVILTLNPLDSLGDNQVYEKQQAGFTAINLNKLNFNKQTAEDISKGVYQFVYLSPEIFLNSKLWEEVYFSSEFQNRLGLVVVDEAHMIYIWGLVESRPGRHLATILSRLEDFGIFRPSYGLLGGHLLSRNDKPILLLSATCRPIAVEAIKKSLKLEDSNVDIIRGELTRPEIRIIRVPMEHSMISCHDLVKVFPSANDVTNEELVPSLVYSGSRNRTLTALDVISMARETPSESSNPKSGCARRYHSCTGDQDKLDCVEDFSTGKFPIVSCTMALGLGQNWKRVRMVVHMGRGDPASIVQMVGRCGRDGRPGLAILFVEKFRRNGKNSVADFKEGTTQSDDDRMDALAITPVCLRIAFSIDNLLGYIPLRVDDPNCLLEKAREEKEQFEPCCCSNCDGPAAVRLMGNLPFANIHNFDDLWSNQYNSSREVDPTSKLPVKKSIFRKRKVPDAENGALEAFQRELVDEFAALYYSRFPTSATVQASDRFGKIDAEAIGAYLHQINSKEELRIIIGGEFFDGQLDWLMERINIYNAVIRDEIQTGQATRAKKPRLQGVKASVQEQDLGQPSVTRQESTSISAPKKLTKKQAETLERRRISSEKTAARKLEMDMKEKRKLQIAAIMAEGRAASNTLGSYMLSDISPSSSESRSPS